MHALRILHSRLKSLVFYFKVWDEEVLSFLIYALGRKGGINNAFGQNRFLINMIRDKGERRDGGFIFLVGAYFDILEVGDRKSVCFERNIHW